MQELLHASGVHSINNVVDISNIGLNTPDFTCFDFSAWKFCAGLGDDHFLTCCNSRD